MRYCVLILVALAAPVREAQASAFTRRASLSVLDVPVAETVGFMGAAFGLEFFVQRDREGWETLPFPLSVVVGVGERIDFGLSAQFGGMPGDAVTTSVPVLQWTIAAKYLVFRGTTGWLPSLSVEGLLDRPTSNVRTALRLVASSRPLGPVRVTGFAGADLGFAPLALGPNVGLAVIARHPSGLEGFVEGLYSSGGWLTGAGARWALLEHFGVTASATLIPQESTFRLSVGLAVFLDVPPAPPPAPVISLGEDESATKGPGGPRKYLDDRPHFRLRIRQPRNPEDPAGRHLQYAPEEAGEREEESHPLAPGAAPSAAPPTPDIPPPGADGGSP